MAETKSPEEPLGIHPGKAAGAEGTAEPAERPGRSRWLAFAMLFNFARRHGFSKRICVELAKIPPHNFD